MDKFFRLMPTLVVIFVTSSCAVQKPSSSETRGETRRQGQLRLLLNSDGGDSALMAFEPPITPGQLCRAVNEAEGTHVDVFIQCVQWSDEQMLYPTRVAEVYAKPISEEHERDFEKYPGIRRWAQNVDSLLHAGRDPLEIWIRRSHEAGMEFWPSLRMNDIHKDWSERWPSLRSQWERDNPQVRLGSAVPDRYLHQANRSPQPSHGYSWAMDYALEEVRTRKLAIIAEVCADYDVDGFEMDFLSHPYYFKKGEEAHGLPLMNDFVRQVRARLDEIGRAKGRKLTLLARVLPSLKLNRKIGLDVPTWIGERWVDLVAPATRGYLDISADLTPFVELARGTGVEISGGMSDLYVRDYTGQKTGRATIEMLRAAASAAWQSGVTSLHLFNYDCHATGKGKPGVLFSPGELQALKEIGDPSVIARKDKHYYVTREMGGLTPEAGGEMQLPTEMVRGDTRELRFLVGDDVTAAREEGTLESTSLLVSLQGYDRWDDDLRVQLNGRRLRGRFEGGALRFGGVTPKRGKNLLSLNLRNRPASRQAPIRVQGVELFIDYRD